MKRPSPADAERCISIRCRCKRGEYLHLDDHKFVEKMFRNFPGWYSETERNIFEKTKPFGSV